MAGVKGRSGRKPQPVEHHRLTGRNDTHKADGRLLPASDETVKLAAPTAIPPEPEGLAAHGKALWVRCFTPPVTWISPESDLGAVEAACRLADRFFWINSAIAGIEEGDANQVNAYKDLYTKLNQLAPVYQRALSELGLSPQGRSVLGVAEVVQSRTARGQEELPDGVVSLTDLMDDKKWGS